MSLDLKNLSHKRNKGASAARNTGADFSKASMVFFADDDIIMEPQHALSILRKELLDNSGNVISPVFRFSEENR